MTAKRFKEIYPDIIRSNYCFTDNGEPIGDKEVCDLLNEQHETIQRLKQNIDELLSVDIEEELLKENEQLKQSNEDARHILKREFDFATEQRQKHLDDPVVTNAYDIIRFDMRKALDKLGWLE